MNNKVEYQKKFRTFGQYHYPTIRRILDNLYLRFGKKKVRGYVRNPDAIKQRIIELEGQEFWDEHKDVMEEVAGYIKDNWDKFQVAELKEMGEKIREVNFNSIMDKIKKNDDVMAITNLKKTRVPLGQTGETIYCDNKSSDLKHINYWRGRDNFYMAFCYNKGLKTYEVLKSPYFDNRAYMIEPESYTCSELEYIFKNLERLDTACENLIRGKPAEPDNLTPKFKYPFRFKNVKTFTDEQIQENFKDHNFELREINDDKGYVNEGNQVFIMPNTKVQDTWFWVDKEFEEAKDILVDVISDAKKGEKYHDYRRTILLWDITRVGKDKKIILDYEFFIWIFSILGQKQLRFYFHDSDFPTLIQADDYAIALAPLYQRDYDKQIDEGFNALLKSQKKSHLIDLEKEEKYEDDRQKHIEEQERLEEEREREEEQRMQEEADRRAWEKQKKYERDRKKREEAEAIAEANRTVVRSRDELASDLMKLDGVDYAGYNDSYMDNRHEFLIRANYKKVRGLMRSIKAYIKKMENVEFNSLVSPVEDYPDEYNEAVKGERRWHGSLYSKKEFYNEHPYSLEVYIYDIEDNPLDLYEQKKRWDKKSDAEKRRRERIFQSNFLNQGGYYGNPNSKKKIKNPIKSKAQWRYLHSQHPDIAEKWKDEHSEIDYDDLPEKVEENPLDIDNFEDWEYDCLRKYYADGMEHGVVIKPDGDFVDFIRAKSSKATSTAHIPIYDTRGNIAIHTHPEKISFSNQDIEAGHKGRYSQIRVIHPDGLVEVIKFEDYDFPIDEYKIFKVLQKYNRTRLPEETKKISDELGWEYSKHRITLPEKVNPSCEYTHVQFRKSDNKGKKYDAIFTHEKTGKKKTVSFGADGYEDFTQHHDKERRANYLSRHKTNEDWNDCDTAGALSRYILWGNSTDIDMNEKMFRKMFGLKEGRANPRKIRNSAGCWIFNEKGEILFIHPTNASWWGTYGIPKGQLEKGEKVHETAHREVLEETGADVEMLDYLGEVSHPNGKRIFAFVGKLKNPEIIDKQGRVKKEYLQLEEVDWGGFMDIEDKNTLKRMGGVMKDFIPMWKKWKKENL